MNPYAIVRHRQVDYISINCARLEMLIKCLFFSTLCLTLAAFSVADSASVSGCMDGIKDESEQCDDGNGFNSDGCSIACLLEDEIKWLCSTNDGETTVCCPLLTNPFTMEEVCTCYGAEQPHPMEGFTITDECHKRDIDECNVDNGNCHDKAVCTNIDVTVYGAVSEDPHVTTHTCECRPGLVGDGITTCL
jgi:cysteine-rich repeat protein